MPTPWFVTHSATAIDDLHARLAAAGLPEAETVYRPAPDLADGIRAFLSPTSSMS
jgi:hypothetical protein